jgi:carbamoyltransferase
VDGTARVQTVNRSDNPIFWDLINEFKHLTGTPVVLNTSSNVKDEPIVDAPVDAIRCFFSTGLDYLIMGQYLVSKKDIPEGII